MDLAVIISGVIVAVLTALIIWLFKQPLLWLITHVYNKLFRRLQNAVKVFPQGTVEPLSKKHFVNPADMNRIQQFYAGSNLGWDIIAANGDVERDQLGDLLEKLRAPKREPRIICLSAPSIAGKTTLAWRAAEKLFHEDRATVLWIKRHDDPNVWYRLTEFCQKYNDPIYVLVDDLFKHPEVIEALRFLDPSLPVTILATAQDNEPAPSRLPYSIFSFVLSKPSAEEIDRTLDKLNRRLTDLSREQRNRLNEANDYGVVMIELTAGKDFLQTIRERVTLLRTQDEVVFRAYEYICFCAQYGLSFPETLLQRLDDHGRFFRLPQRARAKGVIDYDEARPGMLKGRNPAWEQVAFSWYGRNPFTVLTEILRNLNKDDAIECQFANLICRALLTSEYGNTQQERAQMFELIKDIYKHVNKVTDLYYWGRIYKSLGQQSVACACTDAALVSPPTNQRDCELLVKYFRESHREDEVLPILQKYIRSSPAKQMFPGFLDILTTHGTPEQIQGWINEIRAWLKLHQENSSMRTRYLGFVEQHAPKQIPKLMEETHAWLKIHPEDSLLRTRYLGLVEQHAPEQIPKLMEETHAWLAEHPDENVRAKAIGILIRNGLNEAAIAMVKEAVPKIDTDIAAINKSILEQYLRLFKNKIEPETVMRLGYHLAERDPSQKTELANWLRDNGYTDEAEKLYQEMSRLKPVQTTGDQRRKNQYGYGRLLLLTKRPKEAEAQFRSVLNTHDSHWGAILGLARALEWQGTQAKEGGDPIQEKYFFGKAEQELKRALWWLRRKKMNTAPVYYRFGWLYIQMERYQEALDAFCKVDQVEGSKENSFGRYWGIGKALTGLHKFEHALYYLEKALLEAGELKPPASEEIPSLIEICAVQQQRRMIER